MPFMQSTHRWNESQALAIRARFAARSSGFRNSGTDLHGGYNGLSAGDTPL
jgi:hypothetical protein